MQDMWRQIFAKLRRKRVQGNPNINILTRTSHRPNGFKRCCESVAKQTYRPIRHIVCFDDFADEEYVSQHEVDYFFIDKSKVEEEPDIEDPGTGPRFIYNLYLNHLVDRVEDGWILVLDDDDYFTDPHALAKVVAAMRYETDMILWQMQYSDGRCLPELSECFRRPVICRIGSPCFSIHSRIAHTIQFDGWKVGDFRYIEKAFDLTLDARWIPEALVQIGHDKEDGFGRRVDIPID